MVEEDLRVRRFLPKDSALLARLHAETVRAINKRDYAQDLIDEWTAEENDETWWRRSLFHLWV